MGAPQATGHGITVTFGTSGYTMQLTSVSHDGAERGELDTTHMGTAAPGAGAIGGKTFMPEDLADPGEYKLTGHENPDSLPPLQGAEEQITVQHAASGADSTGAAHVFQGWIKSVSSAKPRDGLMMRDITVRITGVITPTAGS